MQPRYILTCGMGGSDFRDDLIQAHRGGVDDFCAGRAMRQQRLGHQRASIKADRASGDQVAAAQGDKVGGTRSGPNEMNGHVLASFVSAMAQVAMPSDAVIRATVIFAPGPAAASAAASATDPVACSA